MKKAILLILLPILVFAQSAAEIKILNRDPGGNGLLCKTRNKTILMVRGTPEQMGAAHGKLLRNWVHGISKVMYLVGAGYSTQKNDWFFTRIDEVMQRTKPHTPQRFLQEIDAMSKAAGLSIRDGRVANFFPEMFHCSVVAVRGKATKDGRVVHARVLDYMRDINLQKFACVQLFQPADPAHNTWMSLGYAGFIGTVTAMNEKGLAIGEMGGRGEGDWDGLPMSLLLRELMEQAATVDEAVKIIKKTPLTCEYYYVISDAKQNMVALKCTPGNVLVLAPGEQYKPLPTVPQDTVMFSGGSRAKHLAQRLQKHYGQIDVQTMINIIKRPVAMNSNLHNAIFMPETLDMWCADAGKRTVACDEPYAKVNLRQLREFMNQTLDAVKK